MKSLVLISLLVFSHLLFAQENKEAKKKERFETNKKEALANLEKRISHLQETKSCVGSASDAKALKQCRQEARKKGEGIRAQMREKRKQKHLQKKQRMKQRKKK